MQVLEAQVDAIPVFSPPIASSGPLETEYSSPVLYSLWNDDDAKKVGEKATLSNFFL